MYNTQKLLRVHSDVKENTQSKMKSRKKTGLPKLNNPSTKDTKKHKTSTKKKIQHSAFIPTICGKNLFLEAKDQEQNLSQKCKSAHCHSVAALDNLQKHFNGHRPD